MRFKKMFLSQWKKDSGWGTKKCLYISIDQFNETDDNDDDAATDSMTEAPTFVIRNAINNFFEVPYRDVKKEAAQNWRESE